MTRSCSEQSAKEITVWWGAYQLYLITCGVYVMTRWREVEFPLVTVDCGVVTLTFFRSLKTFRLTFLRMRNKCKIINIQRNNKAFSVYASKPVCLELIYDKYLCCEVIYILTNSIYILNALFFRCTLMNLHISRMRRNVNLNFFNAEKM